MTALHARLLLAVASVAPLLAGCASSTSAALDRLHEVEARWDRLETSTQAALDRLDALLQSCEQEWRQSCPTQVAIADAEFSALLEALKKTTDQVHRAERDLDYASAIDDRRAARGAAMMGAGAAILGGSAARQPVICRTSDTTNPTTVCQ